MLRFWLVSLTLLRKSYGVENEFLQFASNHRVGTEAPPSEGPYQRISIPHSEEFGAPTTSWSHDEGPSVGYTGQSLWQPSASSYELPQFTSHWSDAGAPLSTHLPYELPQGPAFHAPVYPNPVTLQPTNDLPGSPFNALHYAPTQPQTWDSIGSYPAEEGDFPLVSTVGILGGAHQNFASVSGSSGLFSSAPASHIALPQAPVPREYLDRIESLLFEDDPPALTIGNRHSGVGPSTAPAPNSADSTSSWAWMAHLRESQDKLNAQNDLTRQTRGSLMSPSSTSQSKTATSPGRSRKRVEKVLLELPRSMRRLNSAEVTHFQQLKDNLVKNGLAPSYRIEPNNHRFHENEPDSLGLDHAMYHYTPAVFDDGQVAGLLDYVPMLRLATHGQRQHDERMNLMERSIKKWLPIYKATFRPNQQSREMEAKLAILFEHLWIMNTWILFSFDYKNKKGDILHPSQEVVMTWVVNHLLARLPNLTLVDKDLTVYRELNVRIVNYLTTPRIPNETTTTARLGKLFYESETENVLACELAIYILEAFYQTNNQPRYTQAFSNSYCGIFRRLYTFSKAKAIGNVTRWKICKKTNNLYGQIVMEPWSDRESQQTRLQIPLDPILQSDLKRICAQRIKEIKSEIDMRKYGSKGDS